jgi:predicted TPR repeat methyltransferase
VTEAARALLGQGDGAGAERALIAALADHPDDADLLHLLGIAAHTQGRVDEAVRWLEAALAAQPAGPRSASLHNDLGNILLESGAPDRAVTAYESSLALDPDDAPTWTNLSTAQRLGGDLARAGRTALRAIELDRDSEPAWHAFSLALQTLASEGRGAEASALTRRWLEVDPGNPVALHRLAALGEAPAPARASDGYVETVFDGAAAGFDAHIAALGYRAPEEVADELARRLGPPAGTLVIADMGCGTGLSGAALRPYAARLVGCDLSLGMLRQAQQRGCYDALDKAELGRFLRARSAAYDVVACVDTLCYVGDLGEFTAAAATALRPGGLLVATVEHRPGEGWSLGSSGRYRHSADHVREVCARAGLVDLECREAVLREEGGDPVVGLVWSARHAPVPAITHI